jgi:hypothetical protein
MVSAGSYTPESTKAHLLEVIGKLVHVLVVGKKGVGLGAIEVVVPDAEESEEDGEVVI